MNVQLGSYISSIPSPQPCGRGHKKNRMPGGTLFFCWVVALLTNDNFGGCFAYDLDVDAGGEVVAVYAYAVKVVEYGSGFLGVDGDVANGCCALDGACGGSGSRSHVTFFVSQRDSEVSLSLCDGEDVATGVKFYVCANSALAERICDRVEEFENGFAVVIPIKAVNIDTIVCRNGYTVFSAIYVNACYAGRKEVGLSFDNVVGAPDVFTFGH